MTFISDYKAQQAKLSSWSEVQYMEVFGIEGLTADFDQFNPPDLSIPYFIHYTLVCPLDCVTTYNFLQWSSY